MIKLMLERCNSVEIKRIYGTMMIELEIDNFAISMTEEFAENIMNDISRYLLGYEPEVKYDELIDVIEELNEKIYNLESEISELK